MTEEEFEKRLRDAWSERDKAIRKATDECSAKVDKIRRDYADADSARGVPDYSQPVRLT